MMALDRMNAVGFRNAYRRLVIELGIVVVLVGLPIDFPRSTSTAHAWTYILHHPSMILHVVVSALIVVESTALVARAVSRARRSARLIGSLGLAFALMAFGAGFAYTATGQSDSTLTTMTVGWLGAIVAYGIGWRVEHRAGRPTGPRS
jgi:hypothetical protein